IWVLIDPQERCFVYREWPSTGHQDAYIPGHGDLGEWAVPGKPSDGERGPAQRELGWGLKRYIEEIERLESYGNEWSDGECAGGNNADVGAVDGSGADDSAAPRREQIWERWMDGRYGNATKTSTEESVTLIDEMAELGMDFLAAPSEVSVAVSSRGGGEALRLINHALYYDHGKEIDPTNQPHLYCVETVPNTIYALKNWTGSDLARGATKDPIDCLRMLVLCGTSYYDEAMLAPRRSFHR